MTQAQITRAKWNDIEAQAAAEAQRMSEPELREYMAKLKACVDPTGKRFDVEELRKIYAALRSPEIFEEREKE